MTVRLPRLPRFRTDRLRKPSRRLVAGAAAMAFLGAGTLAATGLGPAGDDNPPVRHSERVIATVGARIDTSYFTSGDADEPRPAVMLTHGFGGSKKDVDSQARKLAREGYAVLTWSARGFGRSVGTIGLNDPKAEIADVSRLIDWLAERPEVQLDAKGDPRVGMTGASYGGAAALLGAGYDRRVDAIAPSITYWDLSQALFPGGVYKKGWTGLFIRAGGGCARFQDELCRMYRRTAESGVPDKEAMKLLAERSPKAVGDRIKVPTLFFQGQTDSLFPLGQADAAVRKIKANGAPAKVDWIAGGHDGGVSESARVEDRITDWFDRYLKKETDTGTGPAFRVTRTGGVDSTDGTATRRGATSDSYPGLDGGAGRTREFELASGTREFENPAGGSPAAISSLPGLGDPAAGGPGALTGLSAAGLGLSYDFPGQTAVFDSVPLGRDLRITGSPKVRVKLRSTGAATEDTVIFAKVYDVAPGESRAVLPSSLVTPVRVENTGGDGRTVELTLPAVDYEVRRGHRLRLALASTDFAYASPVTAAGYSASVEGPLRVPTAPDVRTDDAPLPGWVLWLPIGGGLLAAALLLTGRRRPGRTATVDPELAGVPLQITALTKRYARSADRYAVSGLSFRVEQGQVLGLLGPNGAGKTTTLRMLMGLIRPDEGEIRVFGHLIRPGAPVLSRVGAFVEGPGFLPHLSGRANLDLYWAATGRPTEDAHLEEALEIAGLGDALERAVRTYSQGMRQRLALAQAMLGLPELLILDEPTNGLDPPQIREMRKVMIRYARGGRTVIVSSHLLAEVEQTCTHLVVMDRGRLVEAGPVEEITGTGRHLLVTSEDPVPAALADKVAALDGVLAAHSEGENSLVVTLDTDGLLTDGVLAPARLTPARLNAELLRLGVPVSGIGPHRRLEDAFLTLIGDPS